VAVASAHDLFVKVAGTMLAIGWNAGFPVVLAAPLDILLVALELAIVVFIVIEFVNITRNRL
jgi:hypothetical protein